MTGTVRSRATIRRSGMSANNARLIEPWVFPENVAHLSKLERAYFDALEAVDEIGDHKAEAKRSGRSTDEGVMADALPLAARRRASAAAPSR
jgi:hypothetical protein